MRKILIIFLIIMGFLISGCNSFREEHSIYLNEHTINLGDFYEALDNYDTGFDDYQVYLIGEQHGIKDTFLMDIAFTKYLYTKQSVRNVLLEIGYADGQLINLYMETGDEKYLKKIFTNYEGTYAYSNDNYQMYQDLYNYNLKLSEDEKIKFFGIDVQHQVHTGLYYLNLLLPSQEAPELIASAINSLKACITPNQEWWNITEQINESIINYPDEMKEYLSEQYNNFIYGLEGIYQSVEYYNKAHNPEEYREEMMTENFKKIFPLLNAGKAIGFFGGAHISLISEDISRISFAEKINTTTIVAGKVASIYLTYPNGEGMNKNEGTTKVYNDKLTKFLNKNIDFELAFCRLDFNNSPFTNGYQYVVIIKNAQPATRYNLS